MDRYTHDTIHESLQADLPVEIINDATTSHAEQQLQSGREHPGHVAHPSSQQVTTDLQSLHTSKELPPPQSNFFGLLLNYSVSKQKNIVRGFLYKAERLQ